MGPTIDTNILYAALSGERGSSAAVLAQKYGQVSCSIPDSVLVECLNLCRYRLFKKIRDAKGRVSKEDRKSAHGSVYIKLTGVLSTHSWAANPDIVRAQKLSSGTGLDLVDSYLVLTVPFDIVSADKGLREFLWSPAGQVFRTWYHGDHSAEYVIAEMVMKSHPEYLFSSIQNADMPRLVAECKEMLNV